MRTLGEKVLMRSEIPSGMCAKLRTAAASNNRDHARNLPSRTLIIMFNRSHVNIGRALARATSTMALFFTHIPFVVNHTINATPPERLQEHPLLFPTNHTDRTFFVWRLNSARPPHPVARASTHIGNSIGFIFSHKIIDKVIYSGVFKGRQAKHLPRVPLFRGPFQGISRVDIPHFWWKNYYLLI